MNIASALIPMVAALLLSLGSLAAEQDEVRERIDAENRRIAEAMRRADALALAGFYTTDAMVLAPGTDIVRGRAAIQDFWQGAVQSGVNGLELTTLELTPLGDAAIEVGTYVLKDKDGVTKDHGKYVVIWKLVDGQWRLHRDIFNSSVPPPAAPEAASQASGNR